MKLIRIKAPLLEKLFSLKERIDEPTMSLYHLKSEWSLTHPETANRSRDRDAKPRASSRQPGLRRSNRCLEPISGFRHMSYWVPTGG